MVYIFAKDKLVRTKYVFQQEHLEKNDFLSDFTLLDAFLIGTLNRPSEQRVSWRNEEYKADPKHYGVAVSLGHLLYSTQWSNARTIVTHALSGENGAVVHEIEYVSVDLEPWEDQGTKGSRRQLSQTDRNRCGTLDRIPVNSLWARGFSRDQRLDTAWQI